MEEGVMTNCYDSSDLYIELQGLGLMCAQAPGNIIPAL